MNVALLGEPDKIALQLPDLGILIIAARRPREPLLPSI
jgi:hypothetical protein